MENHGNLMQGHQVACVWDSRPVKSILSDSAVACGQSINGVVNDQQRRSRYCSDRKAFGSVSVYPPRVATSSIRRSHSVRLKFMGYLQALAMQPLIPSLKRR